jgi:type IV pilus assembly protein PilC
MPLSELSKETKKVVFKPVKLSPFAKVSGLSVILALRHLAIMLKSGMAIGDGLKSISEQAESPVLRKVFTSILYDVQGGKNLTEAMTKFKKIFSHLVLSLIRIGEESGTLEKNLAFLTEYLKKEHELQKKVKGALMYPLIVLGMAVVEMLGVIFFILPKMDELFKAFEDPPAATVFILNLTQFIRGNTFSLLGGIVGTLILFYLFSITTLGKKAKDLFSLNFPVIKTLTRKNILATLARTITILLESGIPISSALSITGASIDNYVYKDLMKKVEDLVKSGKNIADSMMIYKKYFPPTFVKMIEVGEQTGSLEENLTYLYEFYSEEVDEMSNNLATLLEPVMLIFIGIMIGLLAIMIITPIYQLTGSINAY